MSKAYELSLQGLNAREIADKLGMKYDNVRQQIKKERKKHGTQRENHGKFTKEAKDTRLSTYKYSNGIYEYQDEFCLADGETLTIDKVFEIKGLAKDEWEIVSFTSNCWQSGDKNKYQFKLTVKPKIKNELTFTDIDEFLKNKKFNSQVIIPERKYNRDGRTLEIDVADLHCGLLAWRNETGKDEDLNICKKRFLDGISEVINENKTRKLKKIYFCTLGDIIHIDNGEMNTTTKGTIQQVDGRLPKIFDFAFDMINEALKMLRELDAKIEYIYTCGNHDRYIGYYLVKMLQIANPDIAFDTAPNPQKAIHFGKVLVGLDHGDMQKKNKGTWLLNDYRKEYGESIFVEEHSGHIHTEGMQYINGITVRNVLAQCGNSMWEHTSGYRSLRGIMSFLWDEEKGLKATQYVYF